MTSRVILVIGSIALGGCGGVADSIAKHELTVRVSRHGHAVTDRPVSVAMRAYENVPFTKQQETKTDSTGEARTVFETMWGAAFLVIPPVGLVPPHPPKPVYSLRVAGAQITVSPQTPGVTYRWEHGSWHTDASVSLP
jgi:hypothetical protein